MVLSSIHLNVALKSPRFYGLCLMLFINITCGIAIIGVVSLLLEEFLGFSSLTVDSSLDLME